MRVEEVMTPSPLLCDRAETLVAASRLMGQHDVAALAVTDSNHRLVGMLSVDDLVRWEANRSDSRRWIRNLERTVLVVHVMSHEIVAISSGESISQAARVMQYIGRSVLPVMDSDGLLAGIVSAGDVASVSARSDASLEVEVRDRLRDSPNAAPQGTLNVYVERGTVTLTGMVTSRKRLHALRRKVATVSGVAGLRTERLTAERALAFQEKDG
ncbi:MAG: CBS domain-containing protein [Actinomycetia bacterium]|nr:CBS domain-containing protein [Actinomycetes bacterium]